MAAELLRHVSTIAAMTSTASARREWDAARRRFADEVRGDSVRAELLHRQREAVLAELRRRVGGVYTLAELANAYDGSERWVLDVVGGHAASPGWARTVTLASDAAFHAYSLGAQDYAP